MLHSYLIPHGPDITLANNNKLMMKKIMTVDIFNICHKKKKKHFWYLKPAYIKSFLTVVTLSSIFKLDKP